MTSTVLNAGSGAREFVALEGVSIDRVRIIGWGNGAVIEMHGAVLDYADYLSGDAGVLLNFENGVDIMCGECEVFYD